MPVLNERMPWPISNFDLSPDPDPDNPWYLLKNDIYWLLTHMYDFIVEFLLRNSIFAIRFEKVGINQPTSEFNLSYWGNWVGILQQIGWFFITLPVTVFYPLIMLLSVEHDIIRSPSHGDDGEVRWFFINGVMGNAQWIDQNCIYLEKRFNTGVTGILNKSYGILADIVEFLLGRNFKIDSIPVYLTTKTIIDELRKENVKTVRLVSHSQGTVIASLVMRKLHMDLSCTDDLDCLRKLEVYTFSNACRDFINPGGLVSHIEHYVNERDPIANLGILNNDNNRRCINGEIFINKRKKGHLFNAYYSLNARDYVSPNGATSKLLNLSGEEILNLPIY